MATAETAGSRAHAVVRAWREPARARWRVRWLAVVPLALVPVLVLAGAAPAETPGATYRESRSSAPGNVEGSASTSFPSVSAAGRQVAFESAATNLVPGDLNDVADVFLRDRGPDGRSRDDDRTVLVSVPPSGGQFDGPSSAAAVSADGRSVAFQTRRDKLPSDTTVSSSLDVLVVADDRGEPGGADLWRMEPDGTDLRRLTATPDAAEQAPEWSPDRGRIAFVRGVADAGGGGIWTMNADGGDLQQLTAPSGGNLDAEPTWSPDGSRIAFARVVPGGVDASGIHVVDATGGESAAITVVTADDAEDGDRQPDWSPDGDDIVFSGFRPDAGEFPLNDGTRRRLVSVTVEGSGDEANLTSAGNDVEPRWSPDGASIAFASDRDPAAGFNLYVRELAGEFTVERRLTDTLESDRNPDWRPDGGLVVFDSTRPDDTSRDLYAVDPAGGAPQRVTTNPGGEGGFTTAPHHAPTQLGPDTPNRATAVVRPEGFSTAAINGEVPTGDVQFRLCSPADVEAGGGTCPAGAGRAVGPPVALAPDVAGGASSASSPATDELTPPVAYDQAGTWCWRAEYLSDAWYRASADAGAGQCVAVTAPAPDVSTSAAWDGEAFVDDAAIAGTGAAATPDGSVTFALCGPADVDAAGCPTGGQQVGPVDIEPPGTPSEVQAVLFPSELPPPGVHCWRAEYSGDGLSSPRRHTDPQDECVRLGAGAAVLQDPALGGAVEVVGGAGAPTEVPTGTAAALTVTVGPAGEGPQPTGTVDVFLCGPDEVAPEGCTVGGTPVVAGLPLQDGTATSPPSPPLTTPGTYCWRYDYSGAGLYGPGAFTATGDPDDVEAPRTCVDVIAPPVADAASLTQVYRRDLVTGSTTLVSVGADGRAGNGDSYEPSISDDGRRVAFTTRAREISGGVPSSSEVVVRDVVDGSTTRVSVQRPCSAAASCPPGLHQQPDISGSGRYVAFSSLNDDVDAVNPVTGAPVTGGSDGVRVFVRDLAPGGTTTLESVDGAGGPGDGSEPSLSDDGGTVAFTSYADLVPPADERFERQVFVRDRTSGALRLASARSAELAGGGARGTGDSSQPSVSGDGRTVAFASAAPDLVDGDTNGGPSECASSEECEAPTDVFVHDRVTRTTGRVSVDSAGGQAAPTSSSTAPSVDRHGRHVAFDSDAPNLVRPDLPPADADANAVRDVFVRDRVPVLAVTPDPVDFGAVRVLEASSPRAVTIGNNGAGAAEVDGVRLVGAAAGDFRVVTDECADALLFRGESCVVRVEFRPAAQGVRTARVEVDSTDPRGTVGTALTGQGLRPTATLTPDPVDFGGQRVGTTSPPQPATLRNTSPGPLVVASVAVAGPAAVEFPVGPADDGCTGRTLPAGATCVVDVRFRPGGIGPREATLLVADDGEGSPRTVDLRGTGTGPAAELTPDPVDFGAVALGASQTRVATLRSTGTAPLAVGAVEVEFGGPPGEIALAPGGDECSDRMLAPGVSCAVRVRYTPLIEGVRTAALVVDHDAGGPARVTLTGEGNGRRASLSPDPLDFGDQPVGVTGDPRVATFTNTGVGLVRVDGVATSGADAGDFALAAGGDGCTGLVLGPGISCELRVRFTPTAAGERSGSLVVTDEAAGSPRSIALTGRGAAGDLVVEPDPLDFGEQTVGVLGAGRDVTVRSTGTLPVRVVRVRVVGADVTDFPSLVGTDACTDQVLAPGAACTVRVGFGPTASGDREAAVEVTAEPGGVRTAALRGTGVETGIPTAVPPGIPGVAEGPDGPDDPSAPTPGPTSGADLAAAPVPTPGPAPAPAPTPGARAIAGPAATPAPGAGTGPGALTISPDPVEFAPTAAGEQSVARLVVVVNDGGAPVRVSALEFGGAAAREFSLVRGADTCTGTTLAPGAGCGAGIVLTPTDGGLRSGTLSVRSAAAGPAPRTALRGLSPELEVDPPLGPPGFVATARGTSFPPSTRLTLTWDPGLGEVVVTTDAAGEFETSVLVLQRDRTGPRVLLATAGELTVEADFLVVRGTAQPPDFILRD